MDGPKGLKMHGLWFSFQEMENSFWILNKVIWGHQISFGCDKNQWKALNDIISALETCLYQILDHFHPIKSDFTRLNRIWIEYLAG